VDSTPFPADTADDMILNPGLTCDRSASGRHRGQWVAGEVIDLHPKVVRTDVRFLCLLCGLTMSVQVDTFIPRPDAGDGEATYRIVGGYSHADRE
jgi:hypothetical protein